MCRDQSATFGPRRTVTWYEHRRNVACVVASLWILARPSQHGYHRLVAAGTVSGHGDHTLSQLLHVHLHVQPENGREKDLKEIRDYYDAI